MQIKIPPARTLAAYAGIALALLAGVTAILGRDKAWEALSAVWKLVAGSAVVPALALVVALGACAPQPSDFETPAAYQAAVDEREAKLEKAGRVSEALRSVYIAQVEQWRMAGVDFAVLTPNQQMLAMTACGTATALSTVIATDAVELSTEGAAWCSELVKLLGRDMSQPLVPVPRPEVVPEPVPEAIRDAAASG